MISYHCPSGGVVAHMWQAIAVTYATQFKTHICSTWCQIVTMYSMVWNIENNMRLFHIVFSFIHDLLRLASISPVWGCTSAFCEVGVQEDFLHNLLSCGWMRLTSFMGQSLFALGLTCVYFPVISCLWNRVPAPTHFLQRLVSNLILPVLTLCVWNTRLQQFVSEICKQLQSHREKSDWGEVDLGRYPTNLPGSRYRYYAEDTFCRMYPECSAYSSDQRTSAE